MLLLAASRSQVPMGGSRLGLPGPKISILRFMPRASRTRPIWMRLSRKRGRSSRRLSRLPIEQEELSPQRTQRAQRKTKSKGVRSFLAGFVLVCDLRDLCDLRGESLLGCHFTVSNLSSFVNVSSFRPLKRTSWGTSLECNCRPMGAFLDAFRFGIAPVHHLRAVDGHADAVALG